MAKQGFAVLYFSAGRSVLAGYRFGRYLHLVYPPFYSRFSSHLSVFPFPLSIMLTHQRLQEETARVETSLLTNSFPSSITRCFLPLRASTFDYNLLEPLQKLLRLSSPLAASLANTQMYNGILQKLYHKKAVVRLNLLRIVRSICDPNSLPPSTEEESGEAITNHELFDAIKRLAESDNAVLVRNMAAEVVRAQIDGSTSSDSGSGSSGRRKERERERARRQSSFTPLGPTSAVSAPLTPTHSHAHARGFSTASASAFVEGSVTPRRLAAPPINGTRPSSLYRPKSRDGPSSTILPINNLSMTRRTSAELSGTTAATPGSGLNRSRLPRTSMLRGSRSSLASVSTTSTGNLQGTTLGDSVGVVERGIAVEGQAPVTPRRDGGAGMGFRIKDRDGGKRNSVIGLRSIGLSGLNTVVNGTSSMETATETGGKRRNRTTSSGEGKPF